MPVTVTYKLCSIQANTSLYSLASFMFCTCMYTVMTFFFYHVCNSQLIFPILWDRETVFTEQWTDPDPVQRVNDSNWRILRLFIIFHFFFFYVWEMSCSSIYYYYSGDTKEVPFIDQIDWILTYLTAGAIWKSKFNNQNFSFSTTAGLPKSWSLLFLSLNC